MQQRVIENRQLEEAALGLELPVKLAAIRNQFGTQQTAQRADELHEACESLPEGMRHALAEVRRRVALDELPLLSLLQTNADGTLQLLVVFSVCLN